MVKLRAIEQFTVEKFDELKIVERNQNNIHHKEKTIYYHDIFECTKEMAEYLSGKNKYIRAFVEVIEIMPEEVKEEKKETIKKTTTRKTTKK